MMEILDEKWWRTQAYGSGEVEEMKLSVPLNTSYQVSVFS